MRYYETLYLIDPTLADKDYQEVVTKFNGLIEKNKGVVISVDEWGKKTLAYKVKKYDRGYYVLLQYCGEPDINEELMREFKLDVRVIKYQNIKLSDNADPEALKTKTREGEDKADKEDEAREAINMKTEGDIEKDQEDKNGVQ